MVDTHVDRLAHRWISWRWALLALALTLAVLSAPLAWQLKFDRSVENMFSAEDPTLVGLNRLNRTFGASELVVVAYVDPELMTQVGMQRLEETSTKIRAVPGVATVISLGSLIGNAILDQESPLAQRIDRLLQGYTHGADRQTTAIIVVLKPRRVSSVGRVEIIRRLRQVIAPLAMGTLAGEPVMIADGFRYLERDGRMLGYTSTILLVGTIVLCFRSVRWVLIPMIVVQFTIWYTRAILTLLEIRLTMVSSMLTAIVTVISIATVIHVIIRFREARASGLMPREALIKAFTLLAFPIVWSCTTDAVGFASLCVARVKAIQDFGLIMAVGTLLVIGTTALVIPGLALWGRLDPDPRRVWGESHLECGLRTVLKFVDGHPCMVATMVLLTSGALTLGIWRIEVESDFTQNFRRDSPVVQGYTLVENNLGGAGVWDVMLSAPPKLGWGFLSRVLTFEDMLRKEVPGLTKVISIADGVRALAPCDLDQAPRTLQRLLVTSVLAGMRARMPGFYEALYGEDPGSPGRHLYRIMLRSRERQSSAEKQAQIEAVQHLSDQYFPGAQVTGYFVVLANLIDSTLRDQWLTFVVAAAGITLMMSLAFRSIRLALVALVPNVLPILMVTGTMGWLGLKINMGAAMIAAVSVGLSVDSSIHYIVSFRRWRGNGSTVSESLDAVQQTVGRAVVFSTLALMIGFGALCLSQFVPTVYFGALVSLSIFGGLVGNVVVLPLLLKWVC